MLTKYFQPDVFNDSDYYGRPIIAKKIIHLTANYIYHSDQAL